MAKIDLAAAMSAFVKATAEERRWDELLGDDTRAYRDVLTWAALRLVAGGARLEDVLLYVRKTAELE